MSNKREYTEMTADAKVGLLLGLVFIAIIAFIINGLPDFIRPSKEKPVVETAVTTQAGANLVIEPAVVDVARSLQEKRSTPVRYVEMPLDTTLLDQYAGSADSSSQQQTAVAQTQESAVTQVQPQTEEKPVLTEQSVKSVQPAKQADTVVASKPQPAAVSGLTHVVEDGESLAEVAKMYYGDEEGNKLATIQMLYEANKAILESPDEIRVGDKLVIPDLKSPVVAQKTAQAKKEPAVETLLEKFKNVFVPVEKKTDTATNSARTADKNTAVKTSPSASNKPALQNINKSLPVKTTAKDVVEYTVQSGDYPYKIAKKQLGDGNRYPEILKLNGLSETDRLQVGMKLRIPKK